MVPKKVIKRLSASQQINEDSDFRFRISINFPFSFLQDQEIDTKSQKAKNTGAKLVIEQKPVVEIEDYTSIIVFTSCDGALNATQLHSLNAKFNIQAELETQLSNASVGKLKKSPF